MSRLTLLGTVHRDPSGLGRLLRFLDEQRPDIITLELSLYGLRFRQIMKRKLRKRLLKGLTEIRTGYGLTLKELKVLLRSTGIGGVVAFIDLPFEYKGAKFYSQHHQLPLFLLDISSQSRKLLRHTNELFSPTNLEKIFYFESTPMIEIVEREYSLAARIIRDEEAFHWLKFFPFADGCKERDRIMAERLKLILGRYPRHTVLHISGWQHLLAKKGTLFNFLEDLRPGRVLLGHLSL